MNQLTAYTLRLGDNCLVLSQRLGNVRVTHRNWKSISHWQTLASISLGQARNFLSYAAELAGEGDEDYPGLHLETSASSATYCWLNNQTAILPTPLHASISSMMAMRRSLPV